MKINCKLCKQEKEAKPNTHFLSDFIIKTALNKNGKSERNTGLYFEIDSGKSSVNFNYQQIDSQDVEKYLGRKVTEEEIKNSIKKKDFAVDDSFCKDCENKFTLIENTFNNKLLNSFRKSDLTNKEELILNEDNSKLIRMFFLLQFWRVSVCNYTFTLSEAMSEFLRIKILNNDYNQLEYIPLSITYLETVRDAGDDETEKYKTNNLVNPLELKNPYILLMNDFILQLYDKEPFNFDVFFGINKLEDFKDFLNHHKLNFKVKIVSNTNRKIYLNKLNSKVAIDVIDIIVEKFKIMFFSEFNIFPIENEIKEYLNSFIKNENFNLLDEYIKEFNRSYFEKLKKY